MDEFPGNVILMLDMPPSTLCGIDLVSFTPSARFQGIKEVPPGWHLIFTSSTASQSIRHGKWVFIRYIGPNVRVTPVKKWDSNKEELVTEADGSESLRWATNLDNSRLTPYRQIITGKTGDDGTESFSEVKDDWNALTSYISPWLVERVTGYDWALTSASSARQDLEHIPGLQGLDMGSYGEKELNLIPIDLKYTWRPGAIGRERTDAAQDRSWVFGEITDKTDGENSLLGEMQLTFLAVLTLGNYSCMEQWKRILQLVLTCQDALKWRTKFFTRFLALLKLQLQHCNDVEDGLFDLSDQGGEMLKRLLKRFRRGLKDILGSHESVVGESHKEFQLLELREGYEELELFVKAEFGWELDDSYVRSGKLRLEDGEEVDMDVNDLDAEDETGEYAPVIVNLEDYAMDDTSSFSSYVKS